MKSTIKLIIFFFTLVALAASAYAQSPTDNVQSQKPAPEPIMNEELMARLIKHALAAKEDTLIAAPICETFALCDGKSDMPAKQVMTTQPDGKHYFIMPLKEDSKDIVVAFKHDKVIESYLTNKSGNLRAAAISDRLNLSTHLITNELAAEKFKAEMRLMAELAKDLPPTAATDSNH